MKTVTQLTAEVAAAKEALAKSRHERSVLMTLRSPYKVGEEFVQGTRLYKVRNINASEKTAEVYLDCYYWTAANKWSQGGKIVVFGVGD